MMICSAMCQDYFNNYFGQESILSCRMGYSKVGDCNRAVITFKDVDMASQAVFMDGHWIKGIHKLAGLEPLSV
eukprot:11130265-Karenia_brevis.AAC.1